MFAMIYVGTGTQINTRYNSGPEVCESFLTKFLSKVAVDKNPQVELTDFFVDDSELKATVINQDRIENLKTEFLTKSIRAICQNNLRRANGTALKTKLFLRKRFIRRIQS